MQELTGQQKLFVHEYMVDLCAKQAAIRAGYSPKTAEAMSSKLMAKPHIKAAIAKRMDKRTNKTDITAEKVLQRWWDIATADPNEIIHVRRVCCRHCFGIDYQYQWRDAEEYQQAVQLIINNAKEQDKEPALPSAAGGYGYDKLLRPHPKCPYCQGEGNPELHVEDTRDLKPKAKLLYAGVKQTTAGIEIKFKDQDKALENVAKHLGMFVDKTEISGPDGGPILHKLEDFF